MNTLENERQMLSYEDANSRLSARPVLIIPFGAKCPLPNGELVLFKFDLELDASGNWMLYKQGHWEDGRIKVTHDEAVAANGRRAQLPAVLGTNGRMR